MKLAAELEFTVLGLTFSPVKGPEGNIEFLGHLSKVPGKGISPDTALGRIVAIRSEDDKNILKNFTKEQKRIRNKWMMRTAKNIKQEDLTEMLEQLQNAFTMMAGDLTE